MVLGMLLGTALSMILWTAPLYGDPLYTVELAQSNIQFILLIDAALAVMITIAFFVIARNRPPQPPEVAAVSAENPSIKRMLRDRNVWIVSLGFFAGFGVFIGLTAILEELLQSLGLPVTAGLGSPAIVMILLLSFGIGGAIVLPAVSDKINKRKPFLVTALAVASVLTLILGTSTILELTYIASALLGFFLISVMPIALTTLEELKSVGPELSGASAGLAFELGNLGGFLGSIILELLKTGASYLYSILYLLVVMLIATALVFLIPETGRKPQ
jgi:nitrate/nitrite transporter NarK